MLQEELKQQLNFIDLAVLAGRKRQSPYTGFVHMHPHHETSETIPFYENICFAFALLRQKSKESVLEAKELFEKLFAFKTKEGFFPLFLHEYPKCYDTKILLKIAPICFYALKEFSSVLGKSLCEKMEHILQSTPKDPMDHPLWENRRRALLGLELLPLDTTSFSTNEWAEWIITSSLINQNAFCIPYDPTLQLFLPFEKEIIQDGPEPSCSLVEWLLADGQFSKRLVKDNANQIRCSAFFPITNTVAPFQDSLVKIFWQGSFLHSFVGKGLVHELFEEMEEGKKDLFEVNFFCNRSDETQIFVEGKRSNTFQLKELITVVTPQKKISLRFFLTRGEGDFFGHIFLSNRPSQVRKDDQFYDWQIGLRTLRRSKDAQIKVALSIED